VRSFIAIIAIMFSYQGNAYDDARLENPEIVRENEKIDFLQ